MISSFGLRRWALVACLALSQGGCMRVVSEHGYTVHSTALSDIHVGKDTKTSIEKRFGTPSTTSIFHTNQEESWYYIYRTVVETPFSGKRSLSHRSIMITFNSKGVVTECKQIEGEAAVAFLRNTTREKGYSTNIWKETFRNIGKFGQSSHSSN